VSQDTKQIKVPYYTHYNKLYYNVQKCYILYLELKNNNSRKRKPKRQRVKTGNKSNGLISLITYFGIAATNNTSSLLYTQWIVDTTCFCYITHLKKHFVLYTFITQSLIVVKGLAGTSVLLIRISTVKIRCKIKEKTQAVKLINVYYVLDAKVNLILVN
jgi:hypothetical protein